MTVPRDWLFDPTALKNTPSRKDGIDERLEDRYRREGIRLIMDIGSELKLLPNPTLATAAVYFHRFYMCHSFKEFPRHVTSLGCLFLAGKVEETPKKCRDLVQFAREKLGPDSPVLGRNPMEEVMAIERVLLQTIKFDLQITHPYQYLLQYAKIFDLDKEVTRVIVQMAWTFVNDSLSTMLCLQWESEVIAIALMYLASRLKKIEIVNWKGKQPGSRNEQWWDQFVENLSMDLMEEICHRVLDLYSSGSTAKEPPQRQQSMEQPSTSSPMMRTHSHQSLNSLQAIPPSSPHPRPPHATQRQISAPPPGPPLHLQTSRPPPPIPGPPLPPSPHPIAGAVRPAFIAPPPGNFSVAPPPPGNFSVPPPGYTMPPPPPQAPPSGVFPQQKR